MMNLKDSIGRTRIFGEAEMGEVNIKGVRPFDRYTKKDPKLARSQQVAIGKDAYGAFPKKMQPNQAAQAYLATKIMHALGVPAAGLCVIQTGDPYSCLGLSETAFGGESQPLSEGFDEETIDADISRIDPVDCAKALVGLAMTMGFDSHPTNFRVREGRLCLFDLDDSLYEMHDRLKGTVKSYTDGLGASQERIVILMKSLGKHADGQIVKQLLASAEGLGDDVYRGFISELPEWLVKGDFKQALLEAAVYARNNVSKHVSEFKPDLGADVALKASPASKANTETSGSPAKNAKAARGLGL